MTREVSTACGPVHGGHFGRVMLDNSQKFNTWNDYCVHLKFYMLYQDHAHTRSFRARSDSIMLRKEVIYPLLMPFASMFSTAVGFPDILATIVFGKFGASSTPGNQASA